MEEIFLKENLDLRFISSTQMQQEEQDQHNRIYEASKASIERNYQSHVDTIRTAKELIHQTL